MNTPLNNPHKICDPIHGFIRFDDEEKKVIDSRPFQRLRYIHQMGIAYLIYPGATHKRFEHSLGVMEIVSRIFDTITQDKNNPILPQNQAEFSYWRRLLRIAALCHDLGHLPFSHTAERDLLPFGHEKMTLRFIQSPEMRTIWESIPSLGRNIEQDLVKLVLNERELHELCPNLVLTNWEKILSQTITDDNFGADRVDYLIRDAYYTGVGYGHFDYRQLIDTLCILYDKERNSEAIGISESGIQSIESLWIARYLMYARVYHHPKSRVYSKHLARFICDLFCTVGFPNVMKDYLQWTDYVILSKIAEAAEQPHSFGHQDALCLMNREKSFQNVSSSKFAPDRVFEKIEELKETFKENIFVDKFSTPDKEKLRHFLVRTTDGNVIPSLEASPFLQQIPLGARQILIFSAPSKKEQIQQWLENCCS